jgi:rhodanese-related sulfurtransferase
MKEISVQELKSWLDQGKACQIIDVREDHEREVGFFAETHIPMGEIVDRITELRTDVPVVIHCRSGARSSAVITSLELRYELHNLHNLDGGISAWAEEIDPSIQLDL